MGPGPYKHDIYIDPGNPHPTDKKRTKQRCAWYRKNGTCACLNCPCYLCDCGDPSRCDHYERKLQTPYKS